MIKKIIDKIIIFFPVILFCIFINFYYNGVGYKFSNSGTVVLVFIFSFFLIRKETFILEKKSFLIFFFTLTCLISCFFSDNIYISLKRLIIVFIPFILIFQYFKNEKNIEEIKTKIELNFIYFVLFLCIYALVIFIFDLIFIKNWDYLTHKVLISKFFNLGQIYYQRGELTEATGGSFSGFLWLRPSSLMSNTIGFSQLILFAIIMCINNKMNTLLKSFLIILFFICLIWTFSRINILIMFLIPIIFVALKNKKLLIFFLLTKVFLFFLLIAIQLPFFQGLLNFSYDQLGLGNFLDRFVIFKVSLIYFNDYFVNGVGFGLSSENFIMKLYQLLPTWYNQQELAIASVPITILVETGILGLFLYAFIIPSLVITNNNFHLKFVKNIFLILIVIQLTQYLDISLFRFHPLTFVFAMYLGICCNKNLKINA